MDPRAGLDRCVKSRPHRDSIPGPSTGGEEAKHVRVRGMPTAVFLFIKFCQDNALRASEILGRGVEHIIPHRLLSHAHILSLN